MCLLFPRDPPCADVGLPWLSLVSLQPLSSSVLFLVSRKRKHISLVPSCTSGDFESTLPQVWPWHNAPDRAIHLFVSSQCHPCHKLSNACSSWCASLPTSTRNWHDLFASFAFLLFPHHQRPVRPIAHCSSTARATSRTHVLDGHLFPLVLFTPTRACRCKPVHFSAFALRTSTCLAVVTIRSLVLTPPWSSYITRGKPKHTQVCHQRSCSWRGHDSVTQVILKFTSDVCSCTRQRPHAT